MTVKELIEQLKQFDLETPVIGMCTDPTGYTYKVPISEVVSDSPYDSNGYSGVDGSEMDKDVKYWDHDIDEYIGPEVVLIDLGTV
jgi:hypothetical protein